LRKRPPVAALLFAVASAASAQCSASDGPDGIDSVYTEHLTQVLKRWAPLRADVTPAAREAGSVAITCVATIGSERYVGMIQRQRIQAALTMVEEVLDDIDHYKDLFPGTIDVRVVPGSLRLVPGTPPAARFDTAWVQRPPIFLMPDIHYEMANLVEKTPARAVYRYKLRLGDVLTASDGLIVVEAIDSTTTEFTEYDFFDGHWGLLPTWLVWRESLKGAFQSDVAIRLKAEQPAWDYLRIAAEAERLASLESKRFERCFADRRAVLR
jgi:hypothetical protein